jgi:hypothetical protein
MAQAVDALDMFVGVFSSFIFTPAQSSRPGIKIH